MGTKNTVIAMLLRAKIKIKCNFCSLSRLSKHKDIYETTLYILESKQAIETYYNSRVCVPACALK